jgi:hypothetical protein
LNATMETNLLRPGNIEHLRFRRKHLLLPDDLSLFNKWWPE